MMHKNTKHKHIQEKNIYLERTFSPNGSKRDLSEEKDGFNSVAQTANVNKRKDVSVKLIFVNSFCFFNRKTTKFNIQEESLKEYSTLYKEAPDFN